ncbi:WYL domain-containing protein [Providencia rettgeri]|uniref:WYL domain-containing protein n=1 Tax=Providencia rettgeri TaxID=587 RepID=UPI001CFF0511|nr:WYL domain-containing protein [Providencia rettgeri]EIU7555373.1 WYL domain-containing protein [Providencia rettgeri]MCB4839026.1 WYL domain-containing protein [Providencia rettgeri]
MSQRHRKYDRMAVRLSLLISRLMAGESLYLASLADEFGVSPRTLRRDLHERLAYLDIEYQQGMYRLSPQAQRKIMNKAVLTFARQMGMAHVFPGLDNTLLNLLLLPCHPNPCVIGYASHRTPGHYSVYFETIIQAIVARQHISLQTAERRFEPLAPYQCIYHEDRWYLVAEYQQSLHVLEFKDIQQVANLSSSFVLSKDIQQLLKHQKFIYILPHFQLVTQLAMQLTLSFERKKS